MAGHESKRRWTEQKRQQPESTHSFTDVLGSTGLQAAHRVDSFVRLKGEFVAPAYRLLTSPVCTEKPAPRTLPLKSPLVKFSFEYLGIDYHDSPILGVGVDKKL